MNRPEPYLRPTLTPTTNSPDAEIDMRPQELTITLDPEEAGQIAALLGLTQSDGPLEHAWATLSRWIDEHHPDEANRYGVVAEDVDGASMEVAQLYVVDTYQARAEAR